MCKGSRHKNLWPIHERRRRRGKERGGRGAIYSDRLQTLRISIQVGKLSNSRNARNYGRWRTLTSRNGFDTFDEFQTFELAIKLEPSLFYLRYFRSFEEFLKIVFEHRTTRICSESGLTKLMINERIND